ncbi:MAG: hypothetical protein HYW23_02530 [Candidatus Aenigmarchaeota archaeon]|nr:hypothetical protein [Candidatus Aenigmarchaeota archaeon]
MKNAWMIIIVGILVLASSAYAHMGVSSVEDVMNSMMSLQNVNNTAQLDCNKIPDSEFTELGDAVMGRMVGNTELHEQMDNMMGGEGSASLNQMHLIMGRNWMGCNSTNFQGMMGTYMMPGMMRVMGNYYPGYYNSYSTALIFAVIGWILFLFTLVILILVFAGQIKIRRK